MISPLILRNLKKQKDCNDFHFRFHLSAIPNYIPRQIQTKKKHIQGRGISMLILVTLRKDKSVLIELF